MTPDHHTLARLPDRPSLWLQSYPAHCPEPGRCRRVSRYGCAPSATTTTSSKRRSSLESRYQRMLSGGTKVTPEWIDSMTHIDYDRHMAFAVTTVIDGVEQFVGVGRYVVDGATNSADVALVLADAWQGQGLGRRLLDTLLEHARTAGLREAAGVVLATNKAMLRLARSMGFAVSAEPGDATVVRIRRDLRTATTQPH